MSQTENNNNTPELSTASSGEKIGKYLLFYEIGSGGMASVFIARLMTSTGVGKWVAIKKIHPHLAKEKQFVEMFVDEAHLAAQLQHPNVVQVFDVDEHDGLPYIVMEYLKGENLTALIQTTAKQKQRIPYTMAAKILSYVCEGLHHAHELTNSDGSLLGVVHRDISPQNVFITYDGIVKLVDFGIAKAAGRLTHTQTGYLKGKYAYMSPEQALGQDVDRRSDIFALGIVLYEITTYKRLFKSDSDFEILRKVISVEVPNPSKLVNNYPPNLERIVLKALEQKPENRYQNAREMQKDLEQFINSTGEIIGSAELGELMNSLFIDRIKQRQKLLQAREPKDAKSIVLNLQTESSFSEIESIKDKSQQVKIKPRNKKIFLIAISILVILVLIAFIISRFMISKNAELNIETTPIEALIYFNNEFKGRSPLLLKELIPGQYNLILKKMDMKMSNIT